MRSRACDPRRMETSARPQPAPLPLIRAVDAAQGGHYPHADRSLRRVRSGIYVERIGWESLPEWDRYLIRVHAYALAHPRAVFSHESAAALLGLPLFGHPRMIHLFDARRSKSLVHGDVVAHTSLDSKATIEVSGIRVTTAADTAIDLVRCLPPALGLAVTDAAIRLHGATLHRLREIADGQRSIRGRRRLQWVLEWADGGAESAAESISRAVALWCGFPAPILQAEHRLGTRRYRSDLCWPEFRVLGEVDGWGKYSAGDSPETVLRNEKRREDALRRIGWRIARWEYADALGVDGLRNALLAAGLPVTGAPDSANLRVIARNPRSW